MSQLSELVLKAQRCLKLEPEELRYLLDYIVCSDVPIPAKIRVWALVIGSTITGPTLNAAKPYPFHVIVKYGRSELLPLLLDIYGPFVHAKCDGSTAAQLAAHRLELTSLIHLFRYDPTVITDVNDFSTTAFRILYREFLKVAFKDCQFRKDYPAHLYAYGENPVSNIGIASGKSATYPSIVELPEDFHQIEEVSLGRFHSLFLANGKVFTCGLGRDARLGLGDESDVALPRLIPFSETVVCIAAGLSHSVVCSAKKIYTFGSNAYSQLGIQKKDMVVTPTVAFKLKITDDNFRRCFAGESFSAAFTEEGRWYIAGTNIPSYNQVVTQFVYYPELHHREAMINDLAVVFGAWGCSPKVSVCRGTNLVDSYVFQCSMPCERCMGIFEFSGVCVLVECAVHVVPGEISIPSPNYVLLSRSYCPPIPRNLPVHFVDNVNALPLRLRKAAIAKNGVILLIDEAGLVYEGNLCESLRAYCSSDPNEELLVCVDRVTGLPPAKEVYVSPDGRNKGLILCDLILENFSFINSFSLPKVSGPVKNVKAVCVNKDMSEVATFNTSRNLLMKESDYCFTFFSRWSSSNAKEKLSIRFVASDFALDQFVRFCGTHEILRGLTSNQLFDLLLFADAYGCTNFFEYVVDQYLTNHFDIMMLRDLYSIARYTKKPRLTALVDGLCAVFFPILLDRGFIEDLTIEEVKRIENFCKTDECFQYAAVQKYINFDQPVSGASCFSPLLEDFLNLFDVPNDKYIITNYNFNYQKQVEKHILMEDIKQNSEVDMWLEMILKEIESGGLHATERLLDSLKKGFLRPRTNLTRRMHLQSDQKNGSEAQDFLSKEAQRSNNSIVSKPPANVEGGSLKANAFSATVDNYESSQGRAQSTGQMTKMGPDNSLPFHLTQVSESARPFTRSKPIEIFSSSPSLSTPSPTSTKKFAGWKKDLVMESPREESFRDILQSELSEKTEEQLPPKRKLFWKKPNNSYRHGANVTIFSASPPAKTAWECASTDGAGASTSFREIVADEVALQNEIKTMTTTQLANVETEEIAMNELSAVYQADAARSGLATTILVERFTTSRRGARHLGCKW